MCPRADLGAVAKKVIVVAVVIKFRKVDHSPPSSAEVKECVELYLHSPIRLHGVVLS
jgi:hypothetical protein